MSQQWPAREHWPEYLCCFWNTNGCFGKNFFFHTSQSQNQLAPISGACIGKQCHQTKPVWLKVCPPPRCPTACTCASSCHAHESGLSIPSPTHSGGGINKRRKKPPGGGLSNYLRGRSTSMGGVNSPSGQRVPGGARDPAASRQNPTLLGPAARAGVGACTGWGRRQLRRRRSGAGDGRRHGEEL